MKYYSTNNKSYEASLEQAVIKGLAPDGGLFMPKSIVPFPPSYFETISRKTFQEIGFEVAKQLLGNDVEESDLKRMIQHTISFDAPLVEIEKNIFALELFHGPTLAFKDFGARFLSQLLGHFAKKLNREVTVLVATSGDTGSAVANGFLGVEGTRVVVLYPSGKVSDIQEKQFTTLGKNITALEIDGTFDDCQALVKQAFGDTKLQEKLFLTSANSINIARLIPQTFYYFYAWSILQSEVKDQVVFSVPSGNFGNLTAGLMAKQLGLPIHHFIASTNINDVVPQYLSTKIFQPRTSASTISNAMDVGHPSNFARILDLYNANWPSITKEITGYSFNDEDTRTQMRETFEKNNYVLDPHGAIGLLGLKKYLYAHPKSTGVFLETAHPAKFNAVVNNTLKTTINIPEKLNTFLNQEKISIALKANFVLLKELLLNHSNPMSFP